MYYYIVLCRTRRKRPLSPQLHHLPMSGDAPPAWLRALWDATARSNARAMSVPSAAQQHSSTALVALDVDAPAAAVHSGGSSLDADGIPPVAVLADMYSRGVALSRPYMDKLRRAGPLPERLMPGSIDVGASRAAVSTARAASGTFVRFHDGWAAAHGNPAQRARAAARAAGVSRGR